MRGLGGAVRRAYSARADPRTAPRRAREGRRLAAGAGGRERGGAQLGRARRAAARGARDPHDDPRRTRAEHLMSVRGEFRRLLEEMLSALRDAEVARDTERALE